MKVRSLTWCLVALLQLSCNGLRDSKEAVTETEGHGPGPADKATVAEPDASRLAVDDQSSLQFVQLGARVTVQNSQLIGLAECPIVVGDDTVIQDTKITIPSCSGGPIVTIGSRVRLEGAELTTQGTCPLDIKDDAVVVRSKILSPRSRANVVCSPGIAVSIGTGARVHDLTWSVSFSEYDREFPALPFLRIGNASQVSGTVSVNQVDIGEGAEFTDTDARAEILALGPRAVVRRSRFKMDRLGTVWSQGWSIKLGDSVVVEDSTFNATNVTNNDFSWYVRIDLASGSRVMRSTVNHTALGPGRIVIEDSELTTDAYFLTDVSNPYSDSIVDTEIYRSTIRMPFIWRLEGARIQDSSILFNPTGPWPGPWSSHRTYQDHEHRDMEIPANLAWTSCQMSVDPWQTKKVVFHDDCRYSIVPLP